MVTGSVVGETLISIIKDTRLFPFLNHCLSELLRGGGFGR
jgi:hypothetical protein